MVRAKKLLVDVKKQSSFIVHPFSLFYIDISICVHEHVREDLIHQCIVDLEFITLMVQVCPVQ